MHREMGWVGEAGAGFGSLLNLASTELFIFYLIYGFPLIKNSMTKNKLENNWDERILFFQVMTYPFDLV